MFHESNKEEKKLRHDFIDLILLKKNKILLMLVCYLVSSHQKQIGFIWRDTDHISTVILKKINIEIGNQTQFNFVIL